MLSNNREILLTKVVGVSFENHQELLKNINPEDILELVREPDNQYDKNAIAVYHNKNNIGHISSFVAKDIAPLLDSGWKTLCKAKEITGKDKPNRTLGCNIIIKLIRPENDVPQ